MPVENCAPTLSRGLFVFGDEFWLVRRAGAKNAGLKSGLYKGYKCMPLFQKRLRLPSDHYHGRLIYFVTLGTEKRAPFFADQTTGQWLLRHLLEIAAHRNFSLHAYCIMPDHIHFLCEGLSETCDLVKFVNAFKQRTAYEFRKKYGSSLWQRRYYDHILRPKEVIEDVACYIWWNPVRKGLCADPHHYPLSGSQTIDWMKRGYSRSDWTPSWKPKS